MSSRIFFKKGLILNSSSKFEQNFDCAVIQKNEKDSSTKFV